MLRIVIALVFGISLLSLDAQTIEVQSAEACGQKLSTKVRRARRPTGAARSRAPIAAGPDQGKREPQAGGSGTEGTRRVAGGGSENSDTRRASGGDTVATRTPTREPEPTRGPATGGVEDREGTTPVVDKTEPADTAGTEDTEDTDVADAGDTGADQGGIADGGDSEVTDRPARPARAAKFTDKVFFANGTSSLSGSTKTKLRANAKWLEQNPDKTITVAGHANTVGDPSANQALSELRAQSVKDYLVERGIDESRITVEAYGSDRPEYEPGSSGKNRRVIITVDN